MARISAQAGQVPELIQVDNGSEFISNALDRWTYENAMTLDFSRPGKPTDNPFIESFNGSFRDECLNTNWFCRSTTPIVKSKRGGASTTATDRIKR